MKHIRSKFIYASMSILTASGLLISCTKSVPYESVYKGDGKEAVRSKSEISEKDEYIYVASTDLMNQDSTGASQNRPYWQGEEKIVKFRFTEDSLQVLQANEEERLRDNRTNDKIVLEIPVSHIDYKCAEDRYKKCTNKEEENRDASWNQKSKFVPKFDAMKSVGFSMLPTEMEKVFGTSCFEETASQFLGYELTENSLNIQVQKIFKGDNKCLEKKGKRLSSLEALSDLQSQVIYHYSFTKLNKMVSPNYKKVDYPAEDSRKFGFFTTKTRKYDVDYSRTERQEKQYMNRWNPERSDIVYYLTENFNKPEFASMKKATIEAVEQVNKGLETAGVKFRVSVKDNEKNVPGDVRNSMIILVEDPVVGGPLGYGPTVANPRTGEILSGRVAMYYGNYVSNVQYVYDEAVRELNRERIKEANKSSTPAPQEKISPKAEYHNKLAKYVRAFTSDKFARSVDNKTKSKAIQTSDASNSFAVSKFSPQNLAKMSRADFEKATMRFSQKTKLDDDLAAMSKYCNYPAELFPFNEIVRGTLRDKLKTKELKFWKDLTEDEKKITMDILLPEVWKPTLVHEIGHNLGLRHNFGGSQDKANFYTKDELNKMGVSHEVPYSSVMEYGASELNLLPTLGKYDIAALKFGYNRTVETEAKTTVDVPTTIKDLAATKVELKSYKYCSDEHVEVNPDCKRFDRGTTMNEIVDYLIQSYHEMYGRRNFRNGRESFSQLNDDVAFKSIMSRFQYIRAFMERYESVKAMFNFGDDAKEWESVPWLKETKEAAIKSGMFFIDVLKTPEPMCAVALIKAPEEIVEFVPLANLDPDQISCFTTKLPEAAKDYVVVGQTGKAFNNMKDPESSNNYADQIDVRGIYLDKIAAAKMLFNRTIDSSTFDATEDNYLDIATLKPEIQQMITGMIYGNVESTVAVVDKDGTEMLKAPIAHKVFADPVEAKRSPIHWIQAPLKPEIADALGLPMRRITFQQVMLGILSDGIKEDQSHGSDNRALLDAISVTKTSKVFQLSPEVAGMVHDVGSTRYVVLPENVVAQGIAVNSTMITLLEQLKPEQVDALIAEKTAQAAAPGVAVKSAFDENYQQLPLPVVTAFKQKLSPTSDALNYMLSIMPAANDNTAVAKKKASSDDE